ncbi:hypothetical protein T11_7743 [Trichinella zimbabwensis]|uniref:Reverse transcriptase domain-containing protein n=1 Tax=Trichinella zimbabwensis TaxID=268475 RepID=A0A0V1HB35_9BILA|nr:hypothetical protein T11_7743 [Trichinella zimbabwensis]
MIEEYPPANMAWGPYEDELGKWIEDGWLVLYDESEHALPKDYCHDDNDPAKQEESQTRDGFPGAERPHREPYGRRGRVQRKAGRRQGGNIRIDKSLWPYQTAVFKDKRYCLTRLGFSLNVAPLVMKAVLNCVLSQDPQVRRGTSAYIDDILVNESVVGVDRVKRHLAHYGLTCKTQERATDGARLLGLKVWGSKRS